MDDATMPYVLRQSDDKIECWSSKRLPFEPTGWQKEMREELKFNSSNLLASFGSGSSLGEYIYSKANK